MWQAEIVRIKWKKLFRITYWPPRVRKAFEKAIADIFSNRPKNNIMNIDPHEPEVGLEGVHKRYVNIEVVFSPRARFESRLTIYLGTGRSYDNEYDQSESAYYGSLQWKLDAWSLWIKLPSLLQMTHKTDGLIRRSFHWIVCVGLSWLPGIFSMTLHSWWALMLLAN